ncbi:MAG TPA: choice-of-anchor Q domain-containing protein, partial [Anaerolineae bacterium]
QASSGGAIYNENSLILNATLISRNQATSAGGGIYNAGLGFQPGSVIDSGSIITGNLAATSGGGVFNSSTGQLTLMSTSIISNTANDSFGGGLYNAAQTTLTGVSLIKNNAVSGGGLYSKGNSNLILYNSAVTDNRAGSNGGGIYASSISGALNVNNTQITNNQSNTNGGGLYNDGPASLSGVSLINNSAANGSGGGIYQVGINGHLSVLQSTLSGNLASLGNGGGLFNATTADLAGTLIQDNQSTGGGGIYNSTGAQLSATDSTLYQNHSQQSGGGINNHGTLTLTQSAVYSNTTPLQGGSGIYNIADANLINVTVSYNTSVSAVFNDNGTLKITNATISHNAAPNIQRQAGSVILANTIVASGVGGSGANCGGTVMSAGHNLDSANTCSFTAAGDITNTNPLLGPLQDNGGSTSTRNLSISSPAVGGGDNTSCPNVDQRGITRPQGINCDIGAYEAVGYTNNTTQTVPLNGCIT